MTRACNALDDCCSIQVYCGQNGAAQVTAIDIHLACGIGEAYHGDLEFHCTAEENLLRVHWKESMTSLKGSRWCRISPPRISRALRLGVFHLLVQDLQSPV